MFAKYNKLGGWLLLFELTLIPNLIMSIILLFNLLRTLQHDLLVIYPPALIYKGASCLCLVAVMCLIIYIFIALIKRRRNGPETIRKTLLVLYIVSTVCWIFQFIYLFIISGYEFNVEAFISKSIPSLIKDFMFNLIWRAYFKNSIRVAVYFGIVGDEELEQSIDG